MEGRSPTRFAQRSWVKRAIPQESNPAGDERAPRTSLLLGTAALLGVRLLLTLPRPGPVVIIDEIGYLTNARVLADGVAGQMGTGPFYRGGYSLVLTPIIALFDDPGTAYHLVLGLNALLAASVFPLLYLLLTRGFGASPRSSLWAALAAATYPAVTLTTQAAVSENLLVPLTVAWLLSFAYLLNAREVTGAAAWSGAAGLSAAALYAVHGRMLVAVGVSVLMLVALTVRRRLTVVAAAVGLVALGVGVQGGRMLQQFLVEENYGGRDTDEIGGHLSALGNVDDALTVAGNLVGHTWYLLVATLGVVLILVASEGTRALGALVRASAPVPDLMLGLLLLTAAGVVVVSAVWFNEVTRSDMLVYGRYVEVMAPPLLAVGLVTLADSRVRVHPLGIVGPILALTVVVALLRTGLHVPGGDGGFLLDGTRSRVAHLPGSWLLEAGVVAAAAACLLAVLLPRLRARPGVIAAVFAMLTAAAVVLRAALEVPGGGNRWNASSLPFATDNFVPWSLGAAGLVAAALAGALIVLSRRRPAAVALVVLLLFLPTTAYAERYLMNHSDSVYPEGWTSPEAAVAGGRVHEIAYDLDEFDLIGDGVYQWFLPDTFMVLFHGDTQPPPSNYVISSRAWARTHLDAVALWSDPGRDQTIWRLGGTGRSDRGDARTIVTASGERVRVVPGALQGFVDEVRPGRGVLRVSGWATDAGRRGPADQILVFSGRHLLQAGAPDVERPDLVQHYGEPLRRAGFELRVQTDRARELAAPGRVRVFAVVGGLATQIQAP